MKPHVVHVVGTLQAGGVQKLVIGLAGEPALADVRQSVVCIIDARGELENDFVDAGLAPRECSIAWPKELAFPSYRVGRWLRTHLDVTFPWRFAHLLRKLGADLVHTHVSHRMDLQASGVFDHAKLPFVWTVHGLYAPDPEQKREWQRALTRTRSRPAAITADSGPVRDNLVSRGLARLDEVQIVHAGADVRRFSKPGQRDPAWRRRLGFAPDALVYGTSGRLVEAKAHDVFVDAAKLLLEKVPHARIVIAGGGPLETALRAQIARTNLAGRVELLGYQADIPAFLRELDVYVLPSRSEGFPLALIEALAAGLPCIASLVGGTEEMLGSAGGILVKADDRDALAAAMMGLADSGARARYAATSLAIAERFSYAASANELARIYRGLLRPQ